MHYSGAGFIIVNSFSDIHIYIYICVYAIPSCYTPWFMHIYMVSVGGRQPPLPPPCWWPGYIRPSVKISMCLYAHTAHTIYLQLYCCPYSTFIVAMYSLLRRSHMIYIRASNVLPILSTWYLYKIPPIPQGVGKMLATYYLLVASHASDTLPSPTHPSLLHTAYIQNHDHDVGGCCPNLFS